MTAACCSTQCCSRHAAPSRRRTPLARADPRGAVRHVLGVLAERLSTSIVSTQPSPPPRAARRAARGRRRRRCRARRRPRARRGRGRGPSWRPARGGSGGATPPASARRCTQSPWPSRSPKTVAGSRRSYLRPPRPTPPARRQTAPRRRRGRRRRSPSPRRPSPPAAATAPSGRCRRRSGLRSGRAPAGAASGPPPPCRRARAPASTSSASTAASARRELVKRSAAASSTRSRSRHAGCASSWARSPAVTALSRRSMLQNFAFGRTKSAVHSCWFARRAASTAWRAATNSTKGSGVARRRLSGPPPSVL